MSLIYQRLRHELFTTKEGRKEMFYLMTHSTHFIYSYMASDIWTKKECSIYNEYNIVDTTVRRCSWPIHNNFGHYSRLM